MAVITSRLCITAGKCKLFRYAIRRGIMRCYVTPYYPLSPVRAGSWSPYRGKKKPLCQNSWNLTPNMFKYLLDSGITAKSMIYVERASQLYTRWSSKVYMYQFYRYIYTILVWRGWVGSLVGWRADCPTGWLGLTPVLKSISVLYRRPGVSRGRYQY